MNPEKWPEDAPESDKRKIEDSLENSIDKVGNVDGSIAEDVIETDSMRQQVVFLKEYIDKKKQEENTDAELIKMLEKAKQLIQDRILLDEIYYRNIRISAEERKPDDFDDIADEEKIEKVVITSYSSKSDDETEMLKNLQEKRDNIDDQLDSLTNQMEGKYSEDLKIIRSAAVMLQNKNN